VTSRNHTHAPKKRTGRIPCASEVIGVTFLTHAPVSKKVTPDPDPAPELIGNLYYDSCLLSESLKAESILPHEVK